MTLVKRTPDQMRSGQLYAAERICNEPALMLGMAMGCGKTVTALTAMRYLLDTFQSAHILIIAPLLVAEETWPEEIETWTHTEVLRYEVLTGSAERRENRALRLAEISIINVENINWLIDFWGDDWPYDTVFVDEMSKFKNPSQRNKPTKVAVKKAMDEARKKLPKGLEPWEIEQALEKAAKKLKRTLTRFGGMVRTRKKIDRLYGMTGTMSPNGLLDIWSQYFLIDRGERLGTSYHAYRTRWFDSDYMGYNYTPKSFAFDQIVERIQDITISMRTEDYVDMPDVIYNQVKVHLPEKVMRDYRKFEKTLRLAEHDIEAVNNGVLTGKLLQLCIAEGTEVLCRRGWVPIEAVTPSDMVWDGVEFVSTSGVIYKGMSNTVSCYGVDMTDGHEVLTEKGWLSAGEILNADASERPVRSPVRLPDSALPGGSCEEQGVDLDVPVYLREEGRQAQYVTAKPESRREEVVRLQTRRDASGRLGYTRNDSSETVGYLAGYEKALPVPEGQGLSELRRTWDRHAGRLVQFVFRLLAGHAGRLRGRSDTGSQGQQQGVQPRELPLGVGESTTSQHPCESSCGHSVGSHDYSGGCRASGNEVWDVVRSNKAGNDSGRGDHVTSAKVAVYDLVDCGPRNRFVVRGSDGPLIVHNCNGSIYDEDGNAIEIHDCKLAALDEIIEAANGRPVMVAYSYQFDLDKLRKRYPKAEVVGEGKDLSKRWNAGKIPILLAHPQSAGHGLNLQYGGFELVWYGLCWSLEYYQQLNKRLHRPGQTETVILHHLIAVGTVDERVMEVLPEKAATQDALVEATLYRP